jgi:hypothetical protein
MEVNAEALVMELCGYSTRFLKAVLLKSYGVETDLRVDFHPDKERQVRFIKHHKRDVDMDLTENLFHEQKHLPLTLFCASNIVGSKVFFPLGKE